jgi:hypothetical protein
MNMLEIPMNFVRILMDRCDRDTREYEDLANGMILDDRLKIHCDSKAAIALVLWAIRYLPDARELIKIFPDL